MTSSLTSRSAAATTGDLVRRLVVTFAEIVCLVGTLVGVGVIGTRVEESSGGRLSADATLIAPAGPAFSIWSVIYLGLAAYAVVQWLPRYASDVRFRATGWLAAASMVLNAAWLLITQAGWLWASVLDIVALLVVLILLVRRLVSLPRRDPLLMLVLDATFGLYLGWVAVATCANVAATLVGSGVDAEGGPAVAAAIGVLAVVGVVGALVAQRLTPSWWVAAAMVWGLGWIAVNRAVGAPVSLPVSAAAVLAAGLIVASFARAARRT